MSNPPPSWTPRSPAPLGPLGLGDLVAHRTRADRGLEPLPDALPFSVAHHPASQSVPPPHEAIPNLPQEEEGVGYAERRHQGARLPSVRPSQPLHQSWTYPLEAVPNLMPQGRQ